VHLLQPVPGERHRESARLLRGVALPVPRRDDRANHVRVRPGIGPDRAIVRKLQKVFNRDWRETAPAGREKAEQESRRPRDARTAA